VVRQVAHILDDFDERDAYFRGVCRYETPAACRRKRRLKG
jgi:hypothetical protein